MATRSWGLPGLRHQAPLFLGDETGDFLGAVQELREGLRDEGVGALALFQDGVDAQQLERRIQCLVAERHALRRERLALCQNR